MAELSQKEHLQPSLLDRLTDHEPDQRQESRDKRVLSLQQLRQCVLRDLSWLLNSSALDTVEDLEPYPFAAHSVINYGMPDLAGQTASGVDIPAMERRIREAIVDFEPRILGDSVKVTLSRQEGNMNHNEVVFEIEGELWAQPVPLHILLKSEFDLEAGSVRVTEQAGGRSR
jgi:type VI secretion system protein ImpF